jgi:hypothetical protein
MGFSGLAIQRLLKATGQSEHLADREKHLIGLAGPRRNTNERWTKKVWLNFARK